jgi:hypothetical protein
MNIAKDRFLCGNEIVRNGMLLQKPARQPENTTNDISYELGCVLQLDPDTCMLVASMDELGADDLCVGNDGFIFKSIADIVPEKAFPLNRPQRDYTLLSGQRSFLAKYPANGAFVPLGAKTEDGKPHPAAGTGFLLSNCVPYHTDKKLWIENNTEHLTEWLDLRWDGEYLDIVSHRLTHGEEFGLTLTGPGLSNPISYKEGILFPLEFVNSGCRVVYFTYDGYAWRPEKVGPAFCVDPGRESEASIVYSGGKYIVYTRGPDIGRLYESEDGFSYRFTRSHNLLSSPMVLNCGLDGGLYLTANPSSSREPYIRNPLVAYPVTDGELGAPVLLHDGDGIRDWNHPTLPRADHAVASSFRIGGVWRHFILYRYCDGRERRHQDLCGERAYRYYNGKGPLNAKLPDTGLYSVEIKYDTVTAVPWVF